MVISPLWRLRRNPALNAALASASNWPQALQAALNAVERSGAYRLATRWQWLAAFDSIWDACDAFEALELLVVCEKQIADLIKREIKRVPRHSFGLKVNPAFWSALTALLSVLP